MRRHGSLLMEVVVAVALAAGPLLIAVNLIQSNVAAARFNSERATAQLVLIDLTELLLGAPLDALRQMSNPEASGWIDTFLQERISHLPDVARDQYRREVTPFLGKFSFQLAENIDAKAPGIARLTLSVRVADRAILRVVRLFRPEERVPPK
jgi:hypothetical protein